VPCLLSSSFWCSLARVIRSRTWLGERTRLAEARQARINRPEVAAAYEQTRLRYELGEAVRLRREELGWSQRQLAERAGMSQPGIARFEAGGTTPTRPGPGTGHGADPMHGPGTG
jgi:HTH-type transcriptional regulator / antitoxin HipB